jgi:hypothetical protein
MPGVDALYTGRLLSMSLIVSMTINNIKEPVIEKHIRLQYLYINMTNDQDEDTLH